MVALMSIASVLGTQACSDDGTTPPNAVDAAVTDAFISADTGAVTPVDAAVTDAFISADTGAVTPVDAAPADAGLLAYGTAVWAGTDFVTTELVAMRVPRGGSPGTVLGRAPIAAGDVVLAASGGRLFALLRKTGVVRVMDLANPWISSRDLVLSADAGDYAENPYDVAFLPGVNKAFVARYASNSIAVFDPTSGTRSANVDLSQFSAGGDPDGFVDIAQLLADEPNGKTFALLQRIDQFDWSGKCLPVKPLIVAFSPVGTAVPPAVGAGGMSVELDGANPQHMVLNAAAKKLYVSSLGCAEADAGAVYTRRGIEEVDLQTGAHRWIVNASGTARLSSLLYAEGTAGFVRQGSTYVPWSASSTTLGTAGFSAISPLMVSPSTVLRLVTTAAANDAGVTWTTELMAPATNVSTPVYASPWTSVRPDAAYGVGGVFLPASGVSTGASTRAPAFTPEAMRRRAAGAPDTAQSHF